MGVLVTETLAGGTPALLVGDSDADDTYVEAADTAETAGNFVYENEQKYYASSDYIKVTWQASHSAGAAQQDSPGCVRLKAELQSAEGGMTAEGRLLVRPRPGNRTSRARWLRSR